MDKEYRLPFKVGQLAEARSFQIGFRGAWFRCKIKEISRRRGHWSALLEYFDYPDEKLTWTKLYQVPTHQSGTLKGIRQLMLRPQYPPIHRKREVSDFSSNSEVTIVVDGAWKAGDLVDWWSNDCYWCGKLAKSLVNGKAEIELLPPPLGEGATYEVNAKDLRPSLDWSPEFGWTVPASQDGGSCHQRAQLIQPVSQEKHAMVEGIGDVRSTNGLTLNASFSSHLSGDSPASDEKTDYTKKFVETPLSADSKEAENASKNTSNQTTSHAFSSTHISANPLPALDEKGDSETRALNQQPLNIADPKEASSTSKETSWSNSGSGPHNGDDAVKTSEPTDKDLYYQCPQKRFRTSGGVWLNSVESDSLEAAILDLEELANKIAWLKGIMECGRPVSDAARPSWKFVEHIGVSTKK